MSIAVSYYTNKGGYPVNEDSLKISAEKNRAIIALADGLGGHKNGAVASKTAVDSFVDYMEKSDDILDFEAVLGGYREAQMQIVKKQQELGNMKTTLATLTVDNDKAMIGYAGDSRIYFLSDYQLKYQTSDHSVTYKKYLCGDITREQINDDEDRTSLLNVMGNRNKFKPSLLAEPMLLTDGDAFLICSDGFWEYLYNEEILIDFLKCDEPDKWIKYLLLRHISRTRDENDNFSVIAVFYTDDSLHEQESAFEAFKIDR